MTLETLSFSTCILLFYHCPALSNIEYILVALYWCGICITDCCSETATGARYIQHCYSDRPTFLTCSCDKNKECSEKPTRGSVCVSCTGGGRGKDGACVRGQGGRGGGGDGSRCPPSKDELQGSLDVSSCGLQRSQDQLLIPDAHVPQLL